MKILLIAVRLLWKRKYANLVLVIQVLLSIIMLAQLFVFVVDHMDNMRAVNELPIKDTVVLSLYGYYTTEYASNQVELSPVVESIGKIYMGEVSCNNMMCNFAVYNNSVISHYTPQLQSGVWLLECPETGESTIPAVISSNVGLQIGETMDAFIWNGKSCQITIVGILKEPTQYLYPSGSASPTYFAANSIISQAPVVIVRDTDFGDPTVFEPLLGLPVTKNLFIFMKSDTAEADIDTYTHIWSKYGETTRMTSLLQYICAPHHRSQR